MEQQFYDSLHNSLHNNFHTRLMTAWKSVPVQPLELASSPSATLTEGLLFWKASLYSQSPVLKTRSAPASCIS